MISKVSLLLTVAVASSLAMAATINGSVSGMNGHSIIYVDALPGKTFPAPNERPVVDQKGLRFSPHLLAIQEGTTVDFLNSDNVQHNAFWPSIGGDKKASHNMGTWPKGEKRPFTFRKPGVVPLMCNVHPEMSAFIVVSPTPYFAETDDNGNYTIRDVPAGNYKLVVWHEGAKEQRKQIAVAGDTKADFVIGK
jgi:plastocyanin